MIAGVNGLSIEIIDITPSNWNKIDFSCGSGSQYNKGKNKKLLWYQERFREGLRINTVVDEKRNILGMIEYGPGEYSWRTIKANGFIVINCLQIQRKHTRNGYGSMLLNKCIQESKDKNGIVILTSSKPWINDKRFFVKNGFSVIDKAAPYFELLVKQFKAVELPRLNSGWEERAKKYGEGISVIFSDQCPIFDYAVKNLVDAAKELGIEVKKHKINNYCEAQNAPSPYGTFAILIDGKFITHRIYDKNHYIDIIKDKIGF
jgi:hypothetical protein